MHLYLFTAFLVLPTNQNTCSCKSHFNYASLYFICYKHFINFISTVSLEWLCQDTLYMYHMCSFLCCFTLILFGECPITLEISAGPCLCGNLGKCDVNTDFSCNSAKVPPELCHQCPIKHTYRHVIYSFTCAEIPRITGWWWSKWTHTVCKGERGYR